MTKKKGAPFLLSVDKGSGHAGMETWCFPWFFVFVTWNSNLKSLKVK